MGITVEEFVAELGWDIDSRGLNRFRQDVSALGRDLRAIGRVAAVAAAAIGYAFVKVSKSFSMIEDAEAAFTPVLGSAKKAEELVDKLNTTAAVTPYRFEVLKDAAKQLLPNMGGDIEKTISTIKMLGDTAGGNANKMRSIVHGYNKALLKGKLDQESLNIVAEAGVPIIQKLQKALNLKGKKFFDAVSKGKITVDMMTDGFKELTAEGGMFYRGMEIASKTLTGRMSTLWDNITLALAALGKGINPATKGFVVWVTDITRGVRKWAKANEELITAKATKFFTKLRKALIDVKDALKTIHEFIRSVGGYGPTITRIGVLFASWKLGRLAMSLGTVIAHLMKIGPAMALMTGGKILVVGVLLALIPLLIEDIYTTLTGGKGAFDSWSMALTDTMSDMDEFFASMLDIPVDEFRAGMLDSLDMISNGFETAYDWAVKLHDAIVAIGALIGDTVSKKFQEIGKSILYPQLPSDSIRKKVWLSAVGDVGRFTAPVSNNARTNNVTNDNRQYNVAPSATINQGGADLRAAQRAIANTQEAQVNEAFRSLAP